MRRRHPPCSVAYQGSRRHMMESMWCPGADASAGMMANTGLGKQATMEGYADGQPEAWRRWSSH